MKCTICKHGETEKGFASVTLEKDGSTIVFKRVPALICDNCGEQYIEDAVASELLKRAPEIAKHGVQVDIREYKLEAA